MTSAQQVRYSTDGRSAYAPRASNPGFIAQFSVAAGGTLTPKSPALVGGQFTPGPVAFNVHYHEGNAVVPTVVFPARISGVPSRLDRSAPVLGADNDQVLADWGVR